MNRIGTLATIGLFFAAMSIPLVAGLLLSRWTEPDTGENRTLAAAPVWPVSGDELLAFPSRADAYANDHFRFRRQLVELNNQLRYHLFKEVTSPQLTIGRANYIFFNSHNAKDPLGMIRFLCGEKSDEVQVDRMARQLSTTVAHLAARQLASTLMLVPTKSEIYPEHLPEWLQHRCRRSVSVVPRVLARLADTAPQHRQHVYYPDELMRNLKEVVAVYPPQNFHWIGPGARAVADETAHKRYGLTRELELKVQPTMAKSDLQHFLPGVALSVASETVDFNSSGIVACRGGSCLPELGEVGPILGDIGRYERVAAHGPKLLIVSDSFGAGIAGYFAPYFRSVWHVSINELPRLSLPQASRVKAALYDGFAPDQVLYIFHDSTIEYFDVVLQNGL